MKKNKIGSTPHSAPAHYQSIDELPIFNWNKISETNDLSWLKKNRINGQVTKEEFAKLEKIWTDIFRQFIDHFEFSDYCLRIHAKENEIGTMQHEFILSGDRTICTFIELAKKELAAMRLENAGGSFWKTKVAIEQFLHFQIDPKKTTVIEFHSYLETMNIQRKATA